MLEFNYHDYKINIGENAKENWKLLDKSSKTDIIFHLSKFSSCYLILQNKHKKIQDIDMEIILWCANMCKKYTKYKNLQNVYVDYTFCNNVSKSDEVGEYVYKSNRKVKKVKI